jgi:uncharacterized RDD family membrane protein YckC
MEKAIPQGPATRPLPSAPRPTPSAPAEVLERPRPAGFWLRFWAWLYDTALLGLVVALVSHLVKLAFGVALVAFVLGLIERGITGSLGGVLTLAALFIGWIGAILVSWFLGQVLGWLYYAFFESSSARATPGKSLLSLWVVDANDDRISFWRATLRHVCKFAALFPAVIAFCFLLVRMRSTSEGTGPLWFFGLSIVFAPLLFFIFYGMAGWTRERRALHDILSGCYVVRSKELKSGAAFGLAIGSVAALLVATIVANMIGATRSASSIEQRASPPPRVLKNTG